MRAHQHTKNICIHEKTQKHKTTGSVGNNLTNLFTKCTWQHLRSQKGASLLRTHFELMQKSTLWWEFSKLFLFPPVQHKGEKRNLMGKPYMQWHFFFRLLPKKQKLFPRKQTGALVSWLVLKSLSSSLPGLQCDKIFVKLPTRVEVADRRAGYVHKLDVNNEKSSWCRDVNPDVLLSTERVPVMVEIRIHIQRVVYWNCVAGQEGIQPWILYQIRWGRRGRSRGLCGGGSISSVIVTTLVD